MVKQSLHFTIFQIDFAMACSPPPNFSWVEPKKLAGLALPRMTAHYQYLLDNGIQHLVCLCEKKPPNYDTVPGVKLHHIKIIDFTPPTPEQIQRFLSIVEESNAKGEVRVQFKKCSVTHYSATTSEDLLMSVLTHETKQALTTEFTVKMCTVELLSTIDVH